ncbi:hypothetical protein DSECCO2_580620 [anaerobic digester metagenome]
MVLPPVEMLFSITITVEPSSEADAAAASPAPPPPITITSAVFSIASPVFESADFCFNASISPPACFTQSSTALRIALLE